MTEFQRIVRRLDAILTVVGKVTKADRIFIADLLSEVALNGTVSRLGTIERQRAERLSKELRKPAPDGDDD